MLTIRDAEEAATAAAVGIDAVEWRFPSDRVVPDDGKPAGATAHAIRAAFPGRFRLRFEDGGSAAALVALASVGADEAAWPARAGPPPDMPAGLASIAIIADRDEPGDGILDRLEGRASAVMLDANPRRLLAKGGAARLDVFANACRRAGISFGFAGALEGPDIARLLLLDPDVLCFDVAARAHHDPAGALDVDALRALRALVPRDDAGAATSSGAAKIPMVTDTLFVRDFVVPLSIGAYRAEHGRRQRVRFGVEASIRRAPTSPRDMRDVFSYDIIIETIRVLCERGHVVFVEALAEEIAASLLTHPALTGVTVTVEKLDVVDGRVGIVITRTAADRG